MGIITIKLGNYEEAMKYFQRASECPEKFVLDFIIFGTMGTCLFHLKVYDEAYELLKKSIHMGAEVFGNRVPGLDNHRPIEKLLMQDFGVGKLLKYTPWL